MRNHARKINQNLRIHEVKSKTFLAQTILSKISITALTYMYQYRNFLISFIRCLSATEQIGSLILP